MRSLTNKDVLGEDLTPGAEHPMDATEVPTPTPMPLSGPLERAHAHDIESEASSILFKIPLHSNETQLLP